MLGARPPFRRFMSAIRSSGSRRLGALSGRVREPGRIRREVGGSETDRVGNDAVGNEVDARPEGDSC